MIARLRGWLADPLAAARRSRIEAFGAIVQLTRPRALVFVDRDRARALGLEGGAAWAAPATDGVLDRAPLSAPLEAHLQLTNRCDAGCAGCYTGASAAAGAGEWGLVEWRRALDVLADAGVFHVALGGGESATLPWLGELAAHARARGLVPNLTTSGLAGLDRLLPIADRFGQINVSLDGLGATYGAVRGFDGFARADAALRALRSIKRAVGINVVVTRANFDELPAIFAYARARRLSEVELLRWKPAGRGAAVYERLRCTDAQHRALLPTVLAAARRARIRVKLDCSYTPMIAHHDPGPAVLAQLAVYGCAGGDHLIGAKPSGAITACSFAAPPPPRGDHRPTVTDLPAYWTQADAFGRFRTWREAAAEPCRTCAYLTQCRGGCRVVSAHAGDVGAPDPECPRVVDFRRRGVAFGNDREPVRRRLPMV
ncbi:MAG: SPASM domain-containing protein [Myxococcales bacterium]|nr:SPASM domain-containing protein [Myxococcales bacterium]